MVDNKKILLHNVEMAEHANGAAQYLDALLGGRYVTKEQTRDMIDFLFARTKRNIESCRGKGCRNTSKRVLNENVENADGIVIII